MRLHSGALKYAVLFDVAEMKLVGYPNRIIKRIWDMQRIHSRDDDFAMLLFSLKLATTTPEQYANFFAQTAEAFASFCGAASH